MLGQLVAAQFDLESVVAELQRNNIGSDAAKSALEAIGDLQRQIGGTTGAALGSMRGDVVAAVAIARNTAQQGRAAAMAQTVESILEAASARTRAAVDRATEALFERRIFDPYLQFASAEDEAAYRRRETARREYIEREQARGTPQGELNAANATVEQIRDAGAHGASRSPEYDAMLRDMNGARDAQHAAMRSTRADRVSHETEQPRVSGTADPDLEQIAATFRAAGVLPPPADPGAPGGHGLAEALAEALAQRGGNAVGRT